jgi:hypothetical protein
MFARVTPTEGSASSRIPIHRSELGSGRAANTADGGSTQSAHNGASGSAKGRLKHPPAGMSLRLQSVAPTESPYSECGPLGTHPSRCSLDLFPLRGVPIQPLGLRPPLMCLLDQEPRRPKTRWRMASPHYRVSIRLNLGTTPKTGSDLLGVCHLFRSPRTLQQSRANP